MAELAIPRAHMRLCVSKWLPILIRRLLADATAGGAVARFRVVYSLLTWGDIWWTFVVDIDLRLRLLRMRSAAGSMSRSSTGSGSRSRYCVQNVCMMKCGKCHENNLAPPHLRYPTWRERDRRRTPLSGWMGSCVLYRGAERVTFRCDSKYNE